MLVFDGIIFSLQHNGGISVYFHELLSRFANLHCESKVLMFGDNEVSKEKIVGLEREMPGRRLLERSRSIRVDGSGLFHSSYYRYATQGQFVNIGTVYDFTNERFKSGPRKWVHSWQKFKAIRHYDAVICISESTKADLLEYLPDIPESRIFVTPLAASTAFCVDDAVVAIEDYVVFVGLRSGYKNFGLLVRALRHVPGVRLFVVGGGKFTAGELAELENAIPGRYFHQGALSVEQLKDLYRSALCLVYPSAYEGFGLPVLEAMLARCPVIALRTSSIPEVAGDAALLLDSPQERDLADAIVAVSGPSMRGSLIAKGLARSREFSWDATYLKTRAVYEAVLGHALR